MCHFTSFFMPIMLVIENTLFQEDFRCSTSGREESGGRKMKIAETDRYSIEVNKAINRIYFTIQGFWKDLSDVPNYLSDWERAIKEVTPGFTVLTDARKMKTPTPQVAKLHERAQEMLLKAGLRKTAELIPASVVEQMSLNRYATESGMERKSFENPKQAEAWLDMPIK
jgi:hypothetical protein